MPAVVTPFDDNGAVDEQAFRANLEHQVEHGATGFIVAGCTGEFWALTGQERVRLVELAVKSVGDQVPIIAGTSAIKPAEVIELTKAVEDKGANGALILPPYFVKLSDDEIMANYERISDAVTLPIMLYNIPQNATNAISAKLAMRLSELEQVVAIKESAGDWNNFHAITMAVRDRIRVFCGPSTLYGVSAMAARADGFIDCFPNVWAPGGLDLYHTAVRGDDDAANALQELGIKLTALFTANGCGLYSATKAGMAILGLPGGRVRPPLAELTPDQHAGLRSGLEALGLTALASGRLHATA